MGYHGAKYKTHYKFDDFKKSRAYPPTIVFQSCFGRKEKKGKKKETVIYGSSFCFYSIGE